MVSNKEIFSQIYDSKIWGDGIGVPLSGSGSKPENSITYVNIIKNYILENNIKSVLDFGHGDFEMWKSWGDEAFRTVDYVGIEVAEKLSELTEITHGNSKRKFMFLDINKTPLPSADLLISKDVLQHLSNLDVCKFLCSLTNYKTIIICNDIYIRGPILVELKTFIQLRNRLKFLKNCRNPFFSHRRKVNIDILSGEYRGIDLEKKPFKDILENFSIKILTDYDGPLRPQTRKRIYLLTRIN